MVTQPTFWNLRIHCYQREQNVPKMWTSNRDALSNAINECLLPQILITKLMQYWPWNLFWLTLVHVPMLYWPSNHAILWQLHSSLIGTTLSSRDCEQASPLLYRRDKWKSWDRCESTEVSVKVITRCSLMRISRSIAHSVRAALSANIPPSPSSMQLNAS